MTEKTIERTPALDEKDLRLGANITESQLKQAGKQLEQLRKEVEGYEKQRAEAKGNAEKEFKKTVDEIKSREANVANREKELQGLIENARRDKNFAQEEKGKVLSEKQEAANLKSEYTGKLNAIKQLVESLSK